MSEKHEDVPDLNQLRAALDRLEAGRERIPDGMRDAFQQEVDRLRMALDQAGRERSDTSAMLADTDGERARREIRRAIDKALLRFGGPD